MAPRASRAPGGAVPAAAVSLIVVLCAPGIHAAEPCDVVAARIVSLQGRVEVRAAGAVEWSVVGLNDNLCVGDTIRVGEFARAALDLPDNPNLRLDQLTTLRIVGATATGASCSSAVRRGARLQPPAARAADRHADRQRRRPRAPSS